ncbi:MAG: hypothetical protein ACOYYU_17110 [Chloroflexota bacterium]
MKARRSIYVLSILVVATMITIACGLSSSSDTSVATELPVEKVVTDTPMPKPTDTKRPTWTPKPTNTPDLAATQSYNDFLSQIQKFKDEGLISTTNGEYTELDDFSEDFAQIGWMQSYYFDFELENFVYAAHIAWSTASQTSDTSGCGIVFAIQDDGRNYGTIFDKSRIYFTSTTPPYYYELGKTRGTGRLNFSNPAEADVLILVNENKAYVYVDDQFIGEYTLSMDKPLRGLFGYGIISGTNKDYGTHCDITNARVWDIKP